jgi:hypothetical protein
VLSFIAVLGFKIYYKGTCGLADGKCLGTTHHLCILYNQRDATYTMFFIIISALHVSGGFSAHHQELIKLYVQPWVLSCFPAVYRWCGWVGTQFQPIHESMTIPKAAHTVL